MPGKIPCPIYCHVSRGGGGGGGWLMRPWVISDHLTVSRQQSGKRKLALEGQKLPGGAFNNQPMCCCVVPVTYLTQQHSGNKDSK